MKALQGVRITSLLMAIVMLATLFVPAVSASDESTWKIPPLKFENNCEYQIINAALSTINSDNALNIPNGSIIYHSPDGITTIFNSDGKHYLSAIDAKAKQIETPTGPKPATCVQEIPSGSSIDVNGNITKVVYNGENILTIVDDTVLNATKISVSSYNGWLEYSYKSVNSLSRFDAFWKTPLSPPHPNSKATNFLFSGIEPSDSSAIIQPVLEWNQLDSHRWTGRAWYAKGTTGLYSSPVYVSENDNIYGGMIWNSLTQKWDIIFKDVTTNKKVSLSSNRIGTTNVQVFTALEGHFVEDDGDVPGDTTFNSMTFRNTDNKLFTVSWNKYISSVPSGITNLGVTIYSSDKVKLKTNN
jgi:hypothetical protein